MLLLLLVTEEEMKLRDLSGGVMQKECLNSKASCVVRLRVE